MTRAIVVGIDGSAESQLAMEWAFEEARRSASPLHLLYAASDNTYSGLTDQLLTDLLSEDAQRIVDEAKKRLPAHLVDSCQVEWTLGSPTRVLVHASEDASMVVVGTHGRGALGAAVHGSVSRHVTRHAHSPVVVVRPATAAGQRVVAGLDLDAIEPLLPAAFHQAAARDLPLRVLHAWDPPRIAARGVGITPAGIDLDDLERGERGMAERVVEEWAKKYPQVKVELLVVPGDARTVLVDESRTSDLVVVGPHGRGWFSGLTLGSTSAAVAEHAHCPVMVAR